jgi:hypothetical protein
MPTTDIRILLIMTFVSLVVKKSVRVNLKLFSLFIAILFFVSGCRNSTQLPTHDLSSEERVWMEAFFTGMMLQNRAIYTLCGSKPVTCIALNYYTDEEIQAYYDQMTEEEKRTAIYVEEYQLEQNWEKWERIRSHFPISRFIVYKKNDATDPKYARIYFVDPLKVANVMSENYSIFKDIAGFDFDPFNEAAQIEKGSIFWDRVENNPIVSGLLFGFGLKNSLKFYWEHWGQPEDAEEFVDCIAPRASDSLTDGKSNLENLTVPGFMSFFENDEVIEKYKKEREAIRAEYQGKDFLDYTLQKLTSQ